MNPDFNLQVQDALNWRVFLRNTLFLGLSALAGLTQAKTSSSGLPGFPRTRPRRSGSFICSNPAPSQMDLFDPKPAIADRRGEISLICPERRLTTMTSGQKVSGGAHHF